MLIIVIMLMCLVLSLMVIAHDRAVYHRWYTKKPRFIFLRLNTQEVRDLLAEEGFELCWCCTEKGNIYLTVNSDGRIHGLGTLCDDKAYLSAKEVLALHIHEARQLGQVIVDCGIDVSKFIKEVKLIKKNSL